MRAKKNVKNTNNVIIVMNNFDWKEAEKIDGSDLI